MRSQGILPLEFALQVPFFDVDTMEMVWHGHYVKYLELARCAWLDRLDYHYDAMRDSGYAWPVIDLQLRYVQPARFRQHLVVRVELVEWETRLKLQYQIRCRDSGRRLTRASTTQVAVAIDTGAMCYASPPVLMERIDAALAREAEQ